MYTPKKYQFVWHDGWKEFNRLEDIPFKQTGLSEDLSEERAKGLLVHREELDNQPKFEGFYGPMWNGEGCLRYETQKAYDLYSL